MLTIGQAARELGISASAIRYYESAGLLPAPQRVSGWRKFDRPELERLKVIHTAREFGFSIEEIHHLLDGFPSGMAPSARWRSLANYKMAELDAMIQRATALKYLIEAGLDCGCEDISLCINSRGKACRPVRADRVPLSEIPISG